jgi:hypothetical protein
MIINNKWYSNRVSVCWRWHPLQIINTICLVKLWQSISMAIITVPWNNCVMWIVIYSGHSSTCLAEQYDDTLPCVGRFDIIWSIHMPLTEPQLTASGGLLSPRTSDLSMSELRFIGFIHSSLPRDSDTKLVHSICEKISCALQLEHLLFVITRLIFTAYEVHQRYSFTFHNCMLKHKTNTMIIRALEEETLHYVSRDHTFIELLGNGYTSLSSIGGIHVYYFHDYSILICSCHLWFRNIHPHNRWIFPCLA